MDDTNIPSTGQPSQGGQANQSNVGVPLAIVIAGALIATAVYFSSNGSGGLAQVGGNNPPPPAALPTGKFREVSDSDFVRGNRNAAITVIEYSDFECPFCQRFHPTMQKLINENNDIRWVYRHFPLTSIHPQAQASAAAVECAGRIGGNDVFWQYADKLFENQATLGDPLYERLARDLGVDLAQFNSCRTSSDIAQKISDDTTEAVGNGARGTPFGLVIGADGTKYPIGGALPYENVIAIINQARGN